MHIKMLKLSTVYEDIFLKVTNILTNVYMHVVAFKFASRHASFSVWSCHGQFIYVYLFTMVQLRFGWWFIFRSFTLHKFKFHNLCVVSYIRNLLYMFWWMIYLLSWLLSCFSDWYLHTCCYITFGMMYGDNWDSFCNFVHVFLLPLLLIDLHHKIRLRSWYSNNEGLYYSQPCFQFHSNSHHQRPH